ncbi:MULTISPECIES: F0F1 ATP synthase subunit gamma [unclassified Pseudodesulfovibrio]|uniref:F0F1 ATP synthase subunit gamma n=1 Tax=unclassified Pseudodesulfovibrio TaxID=2661612 RepID=UPI000FEBD3C5|nr:MULTISPECIES: F0F1 ATP synthase subunit gamma [unclassified Pseudodesulfovibrio]MCJ2165436.1 F0F1 ATP synthase subunit gamma [Pseudodesulfovibrio sp. S3-i]RWU03186.1 ATP synthase F1 subunit gamma [Pseudodesulfovibrio sp. S3]
MASLRDVQNQIVGVKKTKQITKAMNMVASAKLRNAQERIERFRPYADKFYEMLGDLAAGADESVHPLLEVRDEVKTVGIMVTTSDRGLCGAFNGNIINKAMKLANMKASEGKTVKMYCIGKKARDAFKKTDYEMVRAEGDAMTHFDFTLAASVGNELIDGYVSGDLDEVHVVFGEFQSMARQLPVDLTILPMAAAEIEDEAASGGSGDYLYEPSVEGLLAELLPRFIKVQVYRGLLDTSCSEHAARMAAMDNATKACDDLTDTLTLLYNKTRQAAITGDLMDIVGGVEALKG